MCTIYGSWLETKSSTVASENKTGRKSTARPQSEANFSKFPPALAPPCPSQDKTPCVRSTLFTLDSSLSLHQSSCSLKVWLHIFKNKQTNKQNPSLALLSFQRSLSLPSSSPKPDFQKHFPDPRFPLCHVTFTLQINGCSPLLACEPHLTWRLSCLRALAIMSSRLKMSLPWFW